MNDFTKSGEFIADLRKSKGMTQSELGELVGAGDKTISKWERGINVPDVIMLSNLAKIFDVSIHEILNGKRDEKLNPKIVKLYENKKIRYSVLAVSIVFLISFIILVMYFCNNFDRFKIYRINSRADKYELTGNIYQAGKHYELIIDDFDDYDKEKYDNFEVFEYKAVVSIEGNDIISLSRINLNNSDDEQITFKELVKRINKTKILISKFNFKKPKLEGILKIELINDKEKVIEEYNFECFLEYHNNRIYYIK